MTRLLLTIGITTCVIWLSDAMSPQRADMKWTHECVHVQQNTWYEAPMKDGAADFANGKVHNLLIDVHCGTIEVRRGENQ